MSNDNKKQDQEIKELYIKRAKMCVRMKNLEDKVGVFIQNDFRHFSSKTSEQIDEIKNWLFKGFIFLIASTLILQIILEFFNE